MAPHDTPMLPPPPKPAPPAEDLAGRIEGEIARQAGGRIIDLNVTCTGEQIILRGRSRTHHAKQLAQQAVLALVDGPAGLANQIAVS
jgi:hypothetical protein